MENRNIAIIKWLMSLKPAQQTKAMLLIVIVVLFAPLSIIFKSNAVSVKKCNIEKVEIIQKYTTEIAAIKDKQILDLQLEKERAERIDSLVQVTNRIIKNNTEK